MGFALPGADEHAARRRAPVAHAAMGFFGRLLRAILALVQGVVYAVLTVTAGVLIGAAVGLLADNPLKGAEIGLYCGCLFAVLGFYLALLQPINPVAFFGWWWRGVFGLQLSIGLAVATYFLQVRLGVHFGLDLTGGFLGTLSVAVAVYLWWPTYMTLFGILFPEPSPTGLKEHVERGGLLSFREILARASRLGGSRRPPDGNWR